MALNIKDPQVDQLARELTARTGETITEAVKRSLRERLERTARPERPGLSERLMEIGRRAAKLRTTNRTVDEILDYDEHGLPR